MTRTSDLYEKLDAVLKAPCACRLTPVGNQTLTYYQQGPSCERCQHVTAVRAALETAWRSQQRREKGDGRG